MCNVYSDTHLQPGEALEGCLDDLGRGGASPDEERGLLALAAGAEAAGEDSFTDLREIFFLSAVAAPSVVVAARNRFLLASTFSRSASGSSFNLACK